MRILTTAARVRAAIAGARTEKDIESMLRAHKIRFSWDTRAGFLAARVPVRSGAVLIVRTASRGCPFRAMPAAPVPAAYRVPVLHPDTY